MLVLPGRESTLIAVLAVVCASALTAAAVAQQADPFAIEDVVAYYGLDSGSDSPRIGRWQNQYEILQRFGVSIERVSALIKRLRDKGRPIEDADLVLRRFERLALDRLPVEPVLDRMLQGLAKNAPYARILSVADSLEIGLRRAAGLIDSNATLRAQTASPDARLELIRHTAYVLDHGVAPEDVEGTLNLAADSESPVEDGCAPMIALGFMLSAGLPSSPSMEVVKMAWDHGHRGPELQLIGQVLAAQHEGKEGEFAETTEQLTSEMPTTVTLDEYERWQSVLSLDSSPIDATGTGGTSGSGTQGSDASGTEGTDASGTQETEASATGGSDAGGAGGVDGANGVDGVNAVDGVDGIDGANGVNGVNGVDGVETVPFYPPPEMDPPVPSIPQAEPPVAE